jgi:undecaprenyl phosphate-alpha-L-ara4N flippase subunit ArnE
MTTQWTGLIMLVAAMVVESFAQMALKIGASGGPRSLVPPYRDFPSRCRCSASARAWIVAGVLGYGLEICFYTLALNCLEVTVAFPLGSLCFVGVAILSKLFLGEAVGRVRWLGIGCILAGTVFLAL